MTEKKVKCQEKDCDYSCDYLSRLKVHLFSFHKIGEATFVCEHCPTKFLFQSDLTKHLLSHNIGERKHKCEFCDMKFQTASNLKEHITSQHTKPEKDIKCEHCVDAFYTKRELNEHTERKHNNNRVKTFICEIDQCNLSYFTQSELTVHQNRAHSLKEFTFKCELNDCNKSFVTAYELKRHKYCHNDVRLYPCDFKDCVHSSRNSSDLKKHKSNAHNIDVVLHYCDYILENDNVCNAFFKRNCGLLSHKRNVHDIGELECEICIKKCGKLHILEKDPEKEILWDKKACRTCYHKITGKISRVEKEIDEWLATKIDAHVILDKRVNGDACLKYRPDIAYSMPAMNGNPALIIYKEIDENQHSHYSCDEKRMSDLYDETPGAIVAFIRYNPHGYKTKGTGSDYIKTGEDRLQLLLDTFNYIIKNYEKLPLLSVYYVCYSKDNPVIAQNIPKTLVYSNNDLVPLK